MMTAELTEVAKLLHIEVILKKKGCRYIYIYKVQIMFIIVLLN